jgi:hypothetical protein
MNPDFVDLLLAFNAHDVRYLVVGAYALAALTVLTFADAWPAGLDGVLGDVPVRFIGREAFVRNKRATGRARDLGDIESLLD